jgi:xanthine dehydrogenase small subunit
MADVKTRNEIRFLLNGETVALLEVAPDETLLDYLRLRRSLRGSKEGCAEGDCGACTVLVGRFANGELVYKRQRLHPVRWPARRLPCGYGRASQRQKRRTAPGPAGIGGFHGSQCGFCTPGFVMSLTPCGCGAQPTDAEIEKALQGNLCRCTGYEAIVRAARAISTYGKAAKDPLAVERAGVAKKLAAMNDGARVEIGKGEHRLAIPANVDDFAALLEAEPKATIVAGATDVGLWVTKFMREISPAVFISGLDEMRTISEHDGVITIGAGATYTDAFSVFSKRIPALGPLFDRIGGSRSQHGDHRRQHRERPADGTRRRQLTRRGSPRLQGAARRRFRGGILVACSSATAGQANSTVHVPAPAQAAGLKSTRSRSAAMRTSLRHWARSISPLPRRHGCLDPDRLWRHGGDAQARRRSRKP